VKILPSFLTSTREEVKGTQVIHIFDQKNVSVINNDGLGGVSQVAQSNPSWLVKFFIFTSWLSRSLQKPETSFDTRGTTSSIV